MKNLVLLFTVLLIGLTTVTAAEKISANQGEDLITKRYRYAEPILFVERGVEFLIFPDGSFDFNTKRNSVGYDSGHDNAYYKNKRKKRRSVNATYGAPGNRVKYSTPRSRGVIITHDRDGKVRRIGNVFLNYNRSGQIKRIGSVYINYSRRNGVLSQVGGLRVKYNHFGEIIRLTGQVNRYNSSQSCGITNGQSHTNNGYNDDDFYYYKNGKSTKKIKKLKKRK